MNPVMITLMAEAKAEHLVVEIQLHLGEWQQKERKQEIIKKQILLLLGEGKNNDSRCLERPIC